MRTPLIFSTSMHLGLLLFYLFYSFFFTPTLKLHDDNSFVVNFVKIEKVSKAPDLGPAPQYKLKNQEKEKVFENKKVETQKKTEAPKKEIKKTTIKDKNTVAIPDPTKKKPKKISKQNTKKSAGGDGQQRATQIGDVISASEIIFIKHMVKKLWQIPSSVRNTSIDVRVLLSIDATGKVTGAKLVPPKEIDDPELYYLLENSIQAVIEHPEFNFSALCEKTKQLLAKGQPLDLMFNPSDL